MNYDVEIREERKQVKFIQMSFFLLLVFFLRCASWHFFNTAPLISETTKWLPKRFQMKMISHLFIRSIYCHKLCRSNAALHFLLHQHIRNATTENKHIYSNTQQLIYISQ